MIKHLDTDNEETVEYYENGALKKQWVGTPHAAEVVHSFQWWDEDGQLIRHKVVYADGRKKTLVDRVPPR